MLVVHDLYQNTAVVKKMAQVSGMRPSHTICKTMTNSNRLDFNRIRAVFYASSWVYTQGMVLN
jgi:hypothetical protein